MGFNFKSSDNRYKQQAKYTPAKRKTSKWQWYLLVLIIISPLLYFAYNLFSETFIPKAEGIISFKKIELKSPANLYIKEIFVTQGEKVKKEQVLIKLDDPENQHELNFLNNEITHLNEKKSEVANSELGFLKKMKKETEDYIQELTDTYDKLSNLRKRGLATIQEVQDVRYDLDLARIQLQDVNMKISGSKDKQKLFLENSYDSKIRKLMSEVEKIKSKLANTVVTAPHDGTVVEIFANKNELVNTGKDLATISTDEDIHIIAYLPSRFLRKSIHEGTEVKLHFHDGFTQNGVIYKFKKQAELDPNSSNFMKKEKNNIVILVKIKGELPSKYKIYGLPVEVSFDLLSVFF